MSAIVWGAIEGLTIAIAWFFWCKERGNAEWSRAGWDRCAAHYRELADESTDLRRRALAAEEVLAQLKKVIGE